MASTYAVWTKYTDKIKFHLSVRIIYYLINISVNYLYFFVTKQNIMLILTFSVVKF